MDKSPKRKRLRLKYYDYSGQGLYFLTLCCQNHNCYFGSINNDIMQLNNAGFMIEKWYMKIPEKFSTFTIVLKPFHFDKR